MVFTPTYKRLDERQPVTAAIYNQLIVDLQNHLNNLTGADLAAPLVLSRVGQNIDGDLSNYVHSFYKWFGNGINAVVRDVTGKGAQADGSSDDFDAIMDTIDDLPASGGIVFLPPGTYVTSGTINLAGRKPNTNPKDYVLLMGAGSSTVIKAGTNLNAPVLKLGEGRTNQSIMGLTVDGNFAVQSNAADAPSCGIDATRSIKGAIQNVWVQFVDGHGIEVGGSQDLSVTDCYVFEVRASGIAHAEDANLGKGLKLDNVHVFNCGSNDFDDSYGIFLVPCPIDTHIANCVIDDPHLAGIYAGTVRDSALSGLSIQGCRIVNPSTYGILVTSAHNGILAQGILIDDCLLNGGGLSTNDGILLEASGGGILNGFVLSSNNIWQAGDCGIRINRCAFGAVTGNVTRSSGQFAAATRKSGIHLEGAVDGEARHVSISANACFDDGTVPKQLYGIRLEANTKNNTVVANVLNNNVTAAILDEGTDNEIAHNPGHP